MAPKKLTLEGIVEAKRGATGSKSEGEAYFLTLAKKYEDINGNELVLRYKGQYTYQKHPQLVPAEGKHIEAEGILISGYIFQIDGYKIIEDY